MVTLIFFISYSSSGIQTYIFGKISLDFGSLSSFFATIVIVLLFGIDRDIRKACNLAIVGKSSESDFKSLWGVVILAVGIVGLIAIWLAIRTGGLSAYRYVIESNYVFTIDDIFGIVSYILIANLCFTLVSTLSKTRGSSSDLESLRGLITVPIQAIIISLIIVIPRYDDSYFINNVVKGITGYVAIIAVLSASLVVLCMAWLRLSPLARAVLIIGSKLFCVVVCRAELATRSS